MDDITDVFDLARAEIRDIRSAGGEVIVVPLKPDKAMTEERVELLGNDLARYMSKFTGRGYDLSRETRALGGIRYVREPGHQAFGLKLIAENRRVLIGRVAVLEDESCMANYLRHLKMMIEPVTPPHKVEIGLPDDFVFGSEKPTQPEPEPSTETGKEER